MEGPPVAEEYSVGISLQEDVSNCSTVNVTGIYPGQYQEAYLVGRRADYISLDTASSNDSYVLYFEFISSRRARKLSDQVYHEEASHREQGEQELGRRKREDSQEGEVPSDIGDREHLHDATVLEACDTGRWVLAPDDGRFPQYWVGDCSGHPADITETAWYMVECEFCDSELHNASAEIVCAEGSEAGQGGFGPTQSPVPIPTLSPIIQEFIPETLAPFPSEEVDPSNCSVLDVSNAPEEGEYVDDSEGIDGRRTYAHSSGAQLVWLDFANVSELIPKGPMGKLHLVDAEAPGAATLHHGGRLLSTCYDGSWVLTSPSDPDLLLMSPDCAMHPADIDSLWLEPSPVGRHWLGRSPQISISCSGTQASSSSETGAVAYQAASVLAATVPDGKVGVAVAGAGRGRGGAKISTNTGAGASVEMGNGETVHTGYRETVAGLAIGGTLAVLLLVGLVAMRLSYSLRRQSHN